MIRAIDHLVIAVPDLGAATKTYRDLGFTVVAGGRHPGVGTENALITFRDTSYLELVAFHEARPDHRWWTPLHQGGGLVDFCLQTDDLAGDAASATSSRATASAPTAWRCAGSARSPAGSTAGWHRFSSPRRPVATRECRGRGPTPTA